MNQNNQGSFNLGFYVSIVFPSESRTLFSLVFFFYFQFSFFLKCGLFLKSLSNLSHYFLFLKNVLGIFWP